MGLETSGSREVGIGGIGVRRSGLVVRHIDFQIGESASSMHVGGFPGASRPFQNPSRASNVAKNEKCAVPRTVKASKGE